jgi:diguanylate cyclase (GGDEF)-like protein
LGGKLIASENYNVGSVKIRAGAKTVNTAGVVMPVPNAALNVTVFVNYDHVIKDFNQTVFYFVVVALLGMLIIGATVYIASAHMTRSTTQLARYVAQMGTGFESIPESFTQRKDEAGTLSNSFALLLMRLKSALDEKDYLARHDSLTNLKNRYCLEKNIVDLIEKQHPFAYGLLDLDDFKVINDTMGHDEGDKLLKNLASVFRSFKPEELMAYRWGGDEFALIILGDSLQQYEKTLQTLMQRIKDRFNGEDTTRVTVSIGVSIYPECAVTYKNLLITADKALAWAKMTGKVNFCFYEK